jgi:hypothetical protein
LKASKGRENQLLIGPNERPEKAELFIAYAFNQHKMFGSAKRTVVFTMGDDAGSKFIANVRDAGQVLGRSRIDIDRVLNRGRTRHGHGSGVFTPACGNKNAQR